MTAECSETSGDRLGDLDLTPRTTGTMLVGTGHEARAIAWSGWGDPAKPSIVLVHGGAAQGWWWALTAVGLSDDFHVVTVDLSGHGASDWRDHYTHAGWVEEILAVALPDAQARPVVVGHSLGGMITGLVAAHPDAERLAGLIAVDAPVVGLDGEGHLQAERQLGIPRFYPDRDSAVAAFQLRPRQAIVEAEFFDFVAQRSVRREGESWTWLYDPVVFSGWTDRPRELVAQWQQAPCPAALVIGGESPIITSSNRAALDELAAGSAGRLQLEVLPGAAHHLMFDDARGLEGIIRKYATQWTA